jgi:hypothetical protein
MDLGSRSGALVGRMGLGFVRPERRGSGFVVREQQRDSDLQAAVADRKDLDLDFAVVAAAEEVQMGCCFAGQN